MSTKFVEREVLLISYGEHLTVWLSRD